MLLLKTNKKRCFLFIFKIQMATQHVNFAAYGQVGFPQQLLLVANGAVSL